MKEEYLIDVSILYSNVEEKINLEKEVVFCPDYFQNSDIIDLKNVHITGELQKDVNEEIRILGQIVGTMILEDAISLEKVEYPFSFKIDEILEENEKIFENTLDLREILWENIVLEIPLKFTKVTDLSKFHGDGWKLVSEDEVLKQDNPFNELLKDFGEE